MIPPQVPRLAPHAPAPALKRRPGRPPTYVFDRPDAELTENERRLRTAVLKRRERQNRSYRRRKLLKSQQLAAAAAATAAGASRQRMPQRAPPPPLPPPRSRVSDQPLALLEPFATHGDSQAPRAPLYLPRMHAPPAYSRAPPPPPAALPPPPPYEHHGPYSFAPVEMSHRAEHPPADIVYRTPVRAQEHEQGNIGDSLSLPFTSEPASAHQLGGWAPKYEPCAATLAALGDRAHSEQQHVHI